MNETKHTIHVFEKAGLGEAPFRLLGCFEDRGPHVTYENGFRIEVGGPGQPMGSCQYCGTGIAFCFTIESADGKRFVVGSDCVAKTGDAGLRKVVDREANRLKREARLLAEAKRIAAAEQLLEELRPVLVTVPHPMGFTNRDTGEPLTRADWCDWMLKNSGNAGCLRVARMLEKMAKERNAAKA